MENNYFVCEHHMIKVVNWLKFLGVLLSHTYQWENRLWLHLQEIYLVCTIYFISVSPAA